MIEVFEIYTATQSWMQGTSSKGDHTPLKMLALLPNSLLSYSMPVGYWPFGVALSWVNYVSNQSGGSYYRDAYRAALPVLYLRVQAWLAWTRTAGLFSRPFTLPRWRRFLIQCTLAKGSWAHTSFRGAPVGLMIQVFWHFTFISSSDRH